MIWQRLSVQCFLACLMGCFLLPAHALETLNLAVFAYREKPLLAQRFQPLATYLSDSLPGVQVNLLVLDEPVASLDPAGRRDFLRELVEQVLERGTTVVFSTHILSEVEATCDSVIVIYQGRVVEDGTLADVRKKHKNQSLEEIFVASKSLAKVAP